MKGKRILAKGISKALVLMLSFAMFLSTVPMFGWDTFAEEGLQLKTPVLVVTGKGLIGNSGAYSKTNVSLEKSYTLDELKSNEGAVSGVIYSAKNTSSTKNYFKVDGIKISALLGKEESEIIDDVKVLSNENPPYSIWFKQSASYTNAGNGTTIGLNNTRYFYNFATSTKGDAVPAVIGWASVDTGLGSGYPNDSALQTLQGTNTEEKNFLRLYAGQYDGTGGGAEDMNQPLFNGKSATKSVSKVQEGDAIDEVILTVGSKTYTRADILMMKFAEKSYTYQTSGGSRTDKVRGVPLSVLLEGVDGSAEVSFATADGADMSSVTTTVSKAISKDYMLAYETIDGNTHTGIYSTAKNDATKYGFLTLYGDDLKAMKMVNSVSTKTSSGIDFAKSVFKHITNGGITGQNGPYKIDSITGATLTIEGPGAQTSVPLAVKDLEAQNNGCYRGEYTDTRGGKSVTRLYEGVDMYYILNNMQSGTSGIKLTDKASKVSVKNQNRETISVLSLADIKKAHDDGNPILVAYGTAYTDDDATASVKGEASAKPFVFDYTAGGDENLGNYDGCLKLVYDTSEYGKANTDYTKFSNMAYIYVEEESEPGYKHDKSPYNSKENTEYILTLTGDSLGYEVNYTVDDIESLVEYESGTSNIKAGNVYGFKGEYSLANSTYWYVNEYEGVKLWSLFRHSGIKATAGTDDETKNTVVSFKSTDDYGSFDSFKLSEIADDNTFSFYKKNTADPGDGTYPSSDDQKTNSETIRQWNGTEWVGDKVGSGYPVLIAYGVNKYPYVKSNKQSGFLSGLDNSGGPLRIIWGKKNYAHANGSNQAKYVSQVNIGTNQNHYATHKYNTNTKYTDLADNTVSVKITSDLEGGNTKTLKDETVKVGEIEDIAYDGKLKATELEGIKIKAKYAANSGYSDIYEGIDLKYFLNEKIGLTGTQGRVVFKNADGATLEYDLEEFLSIDGYNTEFGTSGLTPIIAYGKNGYPLVSSKNESDGYVKENKYAEGTAYSNKLTVKNSGGPLKVLVPAHKDKNGAEQAAGYLENVVSIEVKLETDKYAHVNEPYDSYADNTIEVKGDGTRLSSEKSFKLSELEGKQSLLVTKDYSFRNSGGTVTQQRYRGIDLYKFLKSTDVGLKSNADKVKITTTDGNTSEFTIAQISDTYSNTETSTDGLPVILAFGSAKVTTEDVKDGKPLVSGKTAEGYDANYENDGGPIKLIIGQTDASDVNKSLCVKNVKSIEVTAGEEVKWTHNQGVFKQYLTDTFTVKIYDKDEKLADTKTYTVADIEDMQTLVERVEMYTTATGEYEGLVLSKFLEQECARVGAGIDNITKANVNKNRTSEFYSLDVYTLGADVVKNGVKDGETRTPLILAYAVDGYPLAFGDKKDAKGDGYDSTVGNDCGPIRLMVHKSQGKCISEVNELEIYLDCEVQVEQAPKFTEYLGSGKSGELPIAGLRSTSADYNGDVFIGTYGGGLSVLDKGSSSFKTYNETSNPGLTTATVSAVAADLDGGVWFSQNASYTDPSSNAGLMYMKDGKLTSYRAGNGTIPNDYVQAIKVAKDGCVWIGSFGGLTKYNPTTGEWQTWDENGDNGATAVDFPAESVSTIELDDDGGVWVGFYPDSKDPTGGSKAFTGGFAYFKNGRVVKSYTYTSAKDSKNSSYRLGDVWVRDIALDSDGNAWIVASGSYSGMDNCGGKLWFVKSGGGSAKQYNGYDLVGKDKLASSDNSEIRALAIDPDGGLWMGTSADGILYAKNPTVKDGALEITGQFNAGNGAWETKNMNNVYSLDFYGKTLYSGTAAGLAVHRFDFTNSYGTVNPVDETSDATAEDSAFTITGQGVKSDAYYSVKGLKNSGAAKQTKTYKIQKSSSASDVEYEGAYLIDILQNIGLKGIAEKVVVYSADGKTATLTIDQLKAEDLKGNLPMIAWKEGGEKIDAKLVVGQSTADEINSKKCLSGVCKVVVYAKAPEPEISLVDKLKKEVENLKNVILMKTYETTASASSLKYNAIVINCEDDEFIDGYLIDGQDIGSELEKVFSDLKCGKTYKHKVTAYKLIDGEKHCGSTITVSAKPVPSVPENVTLTQSGSKKVSVQWDKVEGATKYHVYRSMYPNKKFSKRITTSKLYYRNNNLKKGKTYYYKVRAYRVVNGKRIYGAFSDVQSFQLGQPE